MHELAVELGLTSKEMLYDLLKGMGAYVNSASLTVETTDTPPVTGMRATQVSELWVQKVALH